MSSFKVTAHSDASEVFASDDKVKKITKELETFLKCCKSNPDFLDRNLALYVLDGGNLDPHCCKVIDTDVKSKVAQDFFKLLLAGQKINGKDENWCVGWMGSRWCDMKAERYGLDYIRCAFYTKSSYEGEWKHSKPYVIQITAEKAK